MAVEFAKLFATNGKLIYDEYFHLLKEEEENRIREHDAAALIQLTWHQYKERKYRRLLFKAVVKIQKFYRGYISRVRTKKRIIEENQLIHQQYYNEKAILIQKIWRGYHSRKEIFDYYAYKQYLKEVTEYTYKVNEEIKKHAEQQRRQMETAFLENEEKKIQDLAGKIHHVLSTKIIDGVCKYPNLELTRLYREKVYENELKKISILPENLNLSSMINDNILYDNDQDPSSNPNNNSFVITGTGIKNNEGTFDSSKIKCSSRLKSLRPKTPFTTATTFSKHQHYRTTPSNLSLSSYSYNDINMNSNNSINNNNNPNNSNNNNNSYSNSNSNNNNINNENNTEDNYSNSRIHVHIQSHPQSYQSNTNTPSSYRPKSAYYPSYNSSSSFIDSYSNKDHPHPHPPQYPSHPHFHHFHHDLIHTITGNPPSLCESYETGLTENNNYSPTSSCSAFQDIYTMNEKEYGHINVANLQNYTGYEFENLTEILKRKSKLLPPISSIPESIIKNSEALKEWKKKNINRPKSAIPLRKEIVFRENIPEEYLRKKADGPFLPTYLLNRKLKGPDPSEFSLRNQTDIYETPNKLKEEKIESDKKILCGPFNLSQHIPPYKHENLLDHNELWIQPKDANTIIEECAGKFEGKHDFRTRLTNLCYDAYKEDFQ